jgi:hypothetical protein
MDRLMLGNMAGMRAAGAIALGGSPAAARANGR